MGSRSPTARKTPRERRIRLLPSSLVDQIAAGEVVERPASVLKELVENALDAGAARIRVEIREGGAALIAVTDDGLGMPPGEAAMAIRRHATSKIASAEDLAGILSFGFRGEALPAIASVSRLRILTRPRHAEVGYEIRMESGRVVVEREAGCPQGTRVEVADLFAQVPARRKFLKKPGTEWGHAIDWLGRLAMAIPGTHFEVQRDDREAVVWPGTANPADRIAAVLGDAQAGSLVRVEWEEGAGHLEGYFSGPETSRANGNAIHLYVNGRPVRDKLLRHALIAAYRDLLPRGRFPLAVVFVTVPPNSVDVNVHPAKWEVRFEQPQAVHQLVRHAVREAMGGRGFLAERPPVGRPGEGRAPGQGGGLPVASAS
nr:DNA mismatch repair endonuclease MutL [Myxococcota bacterium]